MPARGRVLVVGGAGYIGSHACKALAQAGYDPVVLDNLSTGHADAVKWGDLVTGDICDEAAVATTLARIRPDLVMHFAALAYVGESVRDPAAYYRTNVAGSLALLGAMRRVGLNRLVFSSSCATYGVPAQLPITEDTPQAPVNPYGFSKLVIERVLADYVAAHGWSAACLRFFNAAGADPAGELGERHDPETHAVPLAILAATRQRPFTLFGTDYPTPDGTAVRDYVHVSDLADAHVRAADALLAGQRHLVANLSTGQGTSVRALIAAVERITGRSVSVVAAPRRPGDPPALYAGGAHARALLGWQPRHSDIDTIITTATPWFGG